MREGDIINILHLSDLHFGKAENADDKKKCKRIFNSLITEIWEIHTTKKPIDFIVISGDVGYAAKKTDYKDKNEDVLDADSFITSLKKIQRKIILCPGNHDKEHKGFRPDKKDPKDAEQKYEENRQILLNPQGEKFSKFKNRRFKEYTAFCNRNNLKKHENNIIKQNHLTGHQFYDKHDIGFLILNTAWLSDPNWNDKGRLEVSKEIINASLSNLCSEEPNIIIAVMHHSPYWLEWSQRYTVPGKSSVINDIVHTTEAILSGHEHCSIFPPDTLNESCKLYVTGCVFEKPEGNNDHYFNSFQVISINTLENSILNETYCYSGENGDHWGLHKQITSFFRSKAKERKSHNSQKAKTYTFKGWNALFYRKRQKHCPSLEGMLSSSSSNIYVNFWPDQKKILDLKSKIDKLPAKKKIHLCISEDYAYNIDEIKKQCSHEINSNMLTIEIF